MFSSCLTRSREPDSRGLRAIASKVPPVFLPSQIKWARARRWPAKVEQDGGRKKRRAVSRGDSAGGKTRERRGGGIDAEYAARARGGACASRHLFRHVLLPKKFLPGLALAPGAGDERSPFRILRTRELAPSTHDRSTLRTL